jgi:hypothetical protein
MYVSEYKSYTEFLSPVMTSDSAMVLGLIRVKFLDVLVFCLNSRRWFVLCFVRITYLMLVHVS